MVSSSLWLLVRSLIIAGNAHRNTGHTVTAVRSSHGESTQADAPRRDLFGHPKGLTVLFATEMWERFSYYGMASLLVLYMVKYLLLPGQVEAVIGYQAIKSGLESMFGPLGPQALASQIYGFYAGFAYLTPIFGGYIADRWLGQRKMAIAGAVLMAIGHFLMAVEALLFIALGFLVVGMGAFKPNVSTQVGALYALDDPRRVPAYSIYYLGINIGAFLAPLIAGTLGGEAGWHYGFGAAGVGMLVALAIYVFGLRHLPRDEVRHSLTAPQQKQPFDRRERHAIRGLLVVFVLTSFFWATYEQQGNTTMLWAEDFTDRRVNLGFWQGQIPSTWFLALNSVVIFAVTPILIRLWNAQRRTGTETSTISKLAFAFICIGFANLIMALAASINGPDGKASPLWLVAYFTILTIGELQLGPVGLALVSRLAPARVLSLMMGLWLAASFPGEILGGWLGGFWSTMDKPQFFLMIAIIAIIPGLAVYALNPILRSVFDETPEVRP
jgi:POT family proton-dependent oligopeptide transporter